VGAIDRDPALVGKSLGELWGAGRTDGAVKVVASVLDLTAQGDVALLTTTSRLDTLEPQLEPLFQRGLNVVSSSEELFYPYLSGRERAERIDALAKKHGVSVTGAGINPGFLMDVLPAVLAVVSGPPFTVRCERYVDLAKRRLPLQKKAGMGMEADAFRKLADSFQIGHVGLVESAAYLSGRLGLKVTTIEESLDPVVAEAPFEWGGQTYPAGRVIGFEHQARAWGSGERSAAAPLQYFLRMSYHQADPRDRVTLTGNPPVDLTIRPCVAGDPATAAVLVHLAAQSPSAPPGLRLPNELGLLPQGPRYHVSA
jgi:4-hydroxy-tetrahydrodipicolinate reductase